jgi:hypothetical protein
VRRCTSGGGVFGRCGRGWIAVGVGGSREQYRNRKHHHRGVGRDSTINNTINKQDPAVLTAMAKTFADQMATNPAATRMASPSADLKRAVVLGGWSPWCSLTQPMISLRCSLLQ